LARIISGAGQFPEAIGQLKFVFNSLPGKRRT